MTVGYPPTHHPNGINNAAIGSALNSLVIPDPTSVHQFFDDFNIFTAAQWTGTATGSVTNAVINADGGVLSLINSAASADLDALQLIHEPFVLTAGKQAWLKARFSLSSATNAAAVIGLQITDTTPLAVSDGFFFSKPSGATTLNFVAEASSVATTTAVGAMADGIMVTVGAHYDGVSSIFLYLNDNRVASCATTNLPSHTLTISMAVSNGTAAANTMNIDYILAATER